MVSVKGLQGFQLFHIFDPLSIPGVVNILCVVELADSHLIAAISKRLCPLDFGQRLVNTVTVKYPIIEK